MAFLSLPASVDWKSLLSESSPPDQFSTLKGKFLPFQSYKEICSTDFSNLHPSIPMLKPSNPSLITLLKAWISSLPDSPANPIHQQEKEDRQTMTDGCGPTSATSFAFVHHPSSSLRTSQTSLTNLTQPLRYSQPFPKRGMMLSGQLSGLPPLVPTTTETDSSSSLIFHLNYQESNTTYTIQTTILPTPTVRDMDYSPHNLRKIAIDNIKRSKNRGISLSNFAHLILPTPTTSDGERSSKNYGKGNLTLQGALTPFHPGGGQHLRLNPLFVEWIMGFPPNYTDYAHSEMPYAPFRLPMPSGTSLRRHPE